ncbi:hypothetical protein KP78_29980 [Jeotgalibacillus soli]|uniref:Uncharacterized protein n=1 Tax=Jeotgalibacillus soli TaxID=889306 RepID=A0A0C2RUP0_9BACL|nr:hypothetical protein KP78_29980 [Jeotgalibacillus soli]
MIFGLGEKATPITINFEEWLKVIRFPVTKIFGKVNTEERFGHL